MRLAVGMVRVVHPLPVFLVVGTSTLVVAILAGTPMSVSFLARACGVVLCSQVAVGALNDFHDRNGDALHQPEKPIPAGDCPPGAAATLVGVGLAGTIVLGSSYGPGPLLLALLGTAAGLAYDLWLKPTPVSFVAYIVGFLSLFTWVLAITERLSGPLLVAYPGGAMALTAAYLAQSFPDIEVDAAMGQRGLAAVLGPRRTFQMILGLFYPVCFGTLAYSLARGVYISAVAATVAGILVLIAWSRARERRLDRLERKRLFRLLAPSIALVVLGGLLVLVDVS